MSDTMGRSQDEASIEMRRRGQRYSMIGSSLISAALLLSCSSSFACFPSMSLVDGFSLANHQHLFRRTPTPVSTFLLGAGGVEDELEDSSWSRAGASSSRFGVRRRVKKVLQRARNRTGIQNSSERQVLITEQSQFTVVAESASIGGLGGVMVDDKGTVDVALEMASSIKNNGQSQQSLPSSFTDCADEGNQTSLESDSKRSCPVEEELFVSAASQQKDLAKNRETPTVVDAIASDIPAAVENFLPEPLPFTLPKLTMAQKKSLRNNERIEEQSKMGRDGSGYVVLDVKAPPYVVWECLLDFESYTETIPTVRDVTLYTSQHLKSGYHKEKPVSNGDQLCRHYGTPCVTRAAFVLSKFRLNIAAIHNYRPHPEGDYMVFTLDPECTNMVLRSAKGVWHTQSNPDGRGEEYTRVWLLCELSVSKLLPSFIVDYAARRAMPRATTWLKPQVEAAATLWLKE